MHVRHESIGQRCVEDSKPNEETGEGVMVQVSWVVIAIPVIGAAGGRPAQESLCEEVGRPSCGEAWGRRDPIP